MKLNTLPPRGWAGEAPQNQRVGDRRGHRGKKSFLHEILRHRRVTQPCKGEGKQVVAVDFDPRLGLCEWLVSGGIQRLIHDGLRFVVLQSGETSLTQMAQMR